MTISNLSFAAVYCRRFGDKWRL